MQTTHHAMVRPRQHAGCFLPFSSFSACLATRPPRHHIKARSGSGPGINEDVLARLKAAEEEAAMLRRKLAAAQGVADPTQAKPKRVDSVDNRETVFDLGKKKERSSWLNETDVDFFTGGAPGEAGSRDVVDPEVQATVQKRVLIGGLVTLGLGAFALVPTEALRFKPSKPMYFYVVPLLRIKDLLAESKPVIEDADWSTLRLILPRVSGPPNNARENLDSVVALLEDRKAQQQAQQLASQFMEDLDSIDYNKYFDAMPTRDRSISGAQNAKFSDFSGRALKAAQTSLDAFLALVPAQVKADAQATMVAY